jgi:hypothetical protein
MRITWFLFILAALLPASAVAQSDQIALTAFADPTENAFAVQVPRGWTVRGGVERLSSITVTEWVTESSPDGATQVFFGDPSVPGFRVPNGNQAEGTVAPPLSYQVPPPVVLAYRPGAAFAEFYGPKSLAAIGCVDARVTGRQPIPGLAQMQRDRAAEIYRAAGSNLSPQPHEAGIAGFTCQIGGRPFAAGVIADTTQPIAAGTWEVTLVAGFLAPPGEQDAALAITSQLIASRRRNPNWVQAMAEAGRQAVARDQRIVADVAAQMQAQSREFTNMILNNLVEGGIQRTAAHNAFMQQMREQSIRNNEQFVRDQARKDLFTWREVAYVHDGILVRDAYTGQHYEISPLGTFEKPW